jgi:hypothetical protein
LETWRLVFVEDIAQCSVRKSETDVAKNTHVLDKTMFFASRQSMATY